MFYDILDSKCINPSFEALNVENNVSNYVSEFSCFEVHNNVVELKSFEPLAKLTNSNYWDREKMVHPDDALNI